MVIATGPAFADYEASGGSPRIGAQGPDGRPWTASVRVHGGYGDNVPLVGDTDPFFVGDRESSFLGATFEGSYRVFEGDGWRAGVSGRADVLGYLEDGGAAALDEYSLYAVGLAAYVTRDFEVAGKPAAVSVIYDYRTEDAGDVEAVGLETHRVTAHVAVAPRGNVVVDASVSISDEDYDVVFSDPTLNDRDSQRVTAKVGAAVKLAGGRHEISASYRYTDNDADGMNWKYDAHQIKAAVASNISGPVFGRLAVAHEQRDYKGFVSGFIPAPGRTDTDVTTVEAQLMWQITREISADAYVRHDRFDSNSSFFSADDTRVGVGVTYRF